MQVLQFMALENRAMFTKAAFLVVSSGKFTDRAFRDPSASVLAVDQDLDILFLFLGLDQGWVLQ